MGMAAAKAAAATAATAAAAAAAAAEAAEPPAGAGAARSVDSRQRAPPHGPLAVLVAVVLIGAAAVVVIFIAIIVIVAIAPYGLAQRLGLGRRRPQPLQAPLGRRRGRDCGRRGGRGGGLKGERAAWSHARAHLVAPLPPLPVSRSLLGCFLFPLPFASCLVVVVRDSIRYLIAAHCSLITATRKNSRQPPGQAASLGLTAACGLRHAALSDSPITSHIAGAWFLARLPHALHFRYQLSNDHHQHLLILPVPPPLSRH